jgi:hypothetical protein
VCSEVFVVWGSLDVLDVWFFFVSDSAIGEFLSSNWLAAAILELATALPVPVEAAHILETGHFLISEFGYNFEHLATVAVHTEDLVTEQVLFEEDLLKNEGSNDKATDDPFC